MASSFFQKLFKRKSAAREQALAEFHTRYASFKDLLQANADIAKIMATLDTVYHGSKSLDTDQIRHEIMRAIVSVRTMNESLSKLSNDRYPALAPVLDNICSHIRNELASYTPGDVTELTLPLSEVDASMTYSVGAKNANLGEIHNMLEMPVPRGFAITTRAAQLFINRNKGLFTAMQKSLAQVDIDHPQSIQRTSDEIYELIMATPLPEEVERALLVTYDKAFGKDPDYPVALRSSAIAEDGVQSFAGQYLSILGVTRGTLLDSFKKVLASLYSPRAIAYRLTNGYELSTYGMAMCCLQMIKAKAAGVAYSRHPVNLRSNDVLINGVWGLGEAVADGSALPDQWLVSRATHKITRETIVGKLTKVMLDKNPDGTISPHVHEVEELLQNLPCLTREHVQAIAKAAVEFEHHYQYPQDIEWALDEDERLYFLQTRPMGFDTTSEDVRAPELEKIRPVISQAEVAARGVACGRVMIMDPDEDMTHFPEGYVLVMTHSSSNATVAMQRACAIVAEVGSLTGHMASVCREYGVPTLINAPGATMLLEEDQLVTVDALKGRVFNGEIPELLELHISRPPVANTPATVMMRRMAPYILPLHLIDPRAETFSPENCTSLHDVMRFIHEKSYNEMFLLSDTVSEGKDTAATSFSGPIPLDLYIIDLGGGLKDPLKSTAKIDEVTDPSPLRTLLEGMLNPTVQANGPRPVNMRGFMSVMGNTMMSANTAERFGDHSYAIVSDKYLNFSSRVGYHYAILDCWCSATVSKNYIRFEFAGGAAGSVQRQRRVRCIGIILKDLGFRVSVIADRVQARYQKYPRTDIMQRLDQLGRLLIMTRQMDMLMTSEEAVTKFASNFLNGDYH